MMKPRLIQSMKYFASFLLLVLVCCGQLYQSAHLHHFHPVDTAAFQVSVHQSSSASAHAETHHHDENPAREGDHEHQYQKRTDWRVGRSSGTKTISLDAACLPPLQNVQFLADLVETESAPIANVGYQKIFAHLLAIRGPPSSA